MRVAIDLIAAEYELGGILLAARSLLHGLAQIDQENEFVVLTGRPDDYQELAKSPNVHIQSVAPPSQSGVLIEHQLSSPYVLQKVRPDILHIPAFVVPVSWNGPLVMTIHDPAFIKIPEQLSFNPKLHHNHPQRMEACGAQRIIAISKQMREEIITDWSIPAERIRLVPYALSPSFQEAPISEAAIQAIRLRYGQRYLLRVDHITPHKNVGRLIKAFDLLAGHFSDLHLVLTGELGYASTEEAQLIETSPYRERIHLAGWITEEDLGPLYAGASVVVFPSKYKEQGILSLEAMACGTPVVASYEAVSMEIAGDAVLRADCSSTPPLAEAIARVLTNEELRTRLIQAGKKQIQPFHHHICAQATLEVYQEVLDVSRYSSSLT